MFGHVVSVDPGGNPAGSPQGVPSALRPQLTLGLPIAPEHWQIHYATVIDPMVNFSILEIWATSDEKSGLAGARGQVDRLCGSEVRDLTAVRPCRSRCAAEQ